MNQAYRNTRFRAELPHGGLPAHFGVVTAWNPDGRTAPKAANDAATAVLQARLADEGLPHFPVTGGSEDFQHAEPGFGVVADQARCLAFGREFHQEAIFWIERGLAHLCPCGDGAPEVLEPWTELAIGAASRPAFHFLGPVGLLDSQPTAFFCSTECPGEKVLAAYEWARAQCDTGATIIGGFHTPVDKDVQAILARRGACLIHVLARSLPTRLTAEQQRLLAEGRLLLMTPFAPGHQPRATRPSAAHRNRWLLQFATHLHIAHAAPGSATAGLALGVS